MSASALVWTVGQTAPPLQGTFLYYPSGKPVDLTGATITAKLIHMQTAQEYALGGTWTIRDAVNGVAAYEWLAADTATLSPGSYSLLATATIPGTGTIPMWRVQLDLVAA